MFVDFAKTAYTLKEGTFVVDPRYKVLSSIGHGAQGLICAARDTCALESTEVAIKKIPNAVDEIISCKRMLREVRMMRHFNHENLLSLRDIMFPPSSNVLQWKDIYLVTDLMDTDLHHVISSKQELSDDHVQYFLYQLLAGVSHLHAAKVVHRDLKPSNILVNRNCDLKICDFGLSRACSGQVSRLDEDNSQPLTMYVTTRWYRAPELLCFNSGYGLSVDMWSIACILGEMLGRVALFPGRDYLDQLRLVIELLGSPTEEEVQLIESPSAVSFVRKVNPDKSKTLEELLPNAGAASLQLLRKILCFDPTKRLTAVEALKDEYVSQYYSDEDDHTSLPHRHSDWLQAVSNTDQLPKEQLQNLIFQEMLVFHPEAINVQWGASSLQANQQSTPEVKPQGEEASAQGVPQAQPRPSFPHSEVAQPGLPAPTRACAGGAPGPLPPMVPQMAHPPFGARGIVQPISPVQPIQVAHPPHGYAYPPPGHAMQPQPLPGQPLSPHHSCQSPSAFYMPAGLTAGYAFPPPPNTHASYPQHAMPLGAHHCVLASSPQPQSVCGHMPAPGGSPPPSGL